MALLFSTLLCTASTPAQLPQIQAQTAANTSDSTLRGAITDPSGAVIPDAEVVLLPVESTGSGQTSLTGRDGHYTFANVLPGSYTVRVTASGFAIFESKPLHLSAGRTQTLDVRLQLETQKFQVDVSSDSADETDPNKNGDAVVLKGKDIDNLPTEPSQLQQELQAMSGGDAPTIYVDGFSGGTMPPKNTIREIRINQNPYSARNDTDPTGGMIEILTKPGSDKLHADLVVFANDSTFNTQNPFTQAQPPYYSTEFNGDVNGPINKHASYFTNFTRHNSKTNAVINAVVLDPSNTNQIPFSQALSSPSTLTRIGSRVDLQPAKNSTVSLHYAYTNNRQSNGGIGQLNLASQGFDSNTDSNLFQASNSQVFGSKIVNDTRFQYIRTRTSQTPHTTDPTILVQGAFTGGGSNLGAFHDNQDSYELQNYISIQAGKHYLSPGIRLRINRDANVSRAGYNGEFLFASLNAYQTAEQALAHCTATQPSSQCQIAGASQFSITTGMPSAVVNVVDFAAFYQDDWKVRPHFTLSYGLRYEVQNYISDHGDFAPRIGFSWGIGNKKDKPSLFVLRGGTGIFYSRLAATNILQTQRLNGVSQQQYVVASPTFYPNIPTPSSIGPQNLSTTYQISPAYRSPYGFMNSIGVDHPLGTHGSVSVQYFYNRVVHSLVTRNINAPLPGTYNPAIPTSGLRPYGTTQNIDEFDSAGLARTNRLSTNINFHTKNEFSIFGYYQFRHRSSDANGGFVSNSYDVAADYGRGSQDLRHVLFFDINSPLLYGRIHLNAYVQANSGAPFNITVGQDLNGDSQFNDRPAFATDLSRPSVVATRYGTFDTNPMLGQTIIPMNYGQSPTLFSLSTEIFRQFTFGPALPSDPSAPKPAAGAPALKGKPYVARKYNLFFAIEAENVINHVNLGPPVGTLGSPLFGQSNSLNPDSGSTNANRVVNLVLFTRF
jgi:hypothetical protein